MCMYIHVNAMNDVLGRIQRVDGLRVMPLTCALV